jgi:hypothetical protein
MDQELETSVGTGGHGRLHIMADRHRARISIVHPPDDNGEHKATSVAVNTADLRRLLDKVDKLLCASQAAG